MISSSEIQKHLIVNQLDLVSSKIEQSPRKFSFGLKAAKALQLQVHLHD